jgi:hypothetical protein
MCHHDKHEEAKGRRDHHTKSHATMAWA